MKYQIGILISVLFCACNNGERCVEKMKASSQSLTVAFEKGDSAKVTKEALTTIDHANCVQLAEGMPVAWLNDASRIKEEAERTLLHIHCRCYNLRLKRVYDEIQAAGVEDATLWKSHYEHWQRWNSTTSMKTGDLVSACANTDLTSITSMRVEMESRNGYFITKDAIEVGQEAVESIISTAKGMWQAIEESLEEEQ